jgi:hypothetical protein
MIKTSKKQIVIYLNDEELKYLDFIYNKKFFPTRASYIRMLINEDKKQNLKDGKNGKA